MKSAVIILIAYIIGSIPFGIIISRARGVDLRKVGSGNIGATNVLRAVGKKEAILTLLGDILKGTVGVLLAKALSQSETVVVLSAIAAVLGHDFSIFLRFKGGKGVATSIGVLIGYAPVVALVTVNVWILVVFFYRYSSLGALVSFTFVPVFMLLARKGYEGMLLSVVLTALIYFKHRQNIKRLLEGREPKIGQSI
jgi:glycerol-3-phosphate acyltransferase PlsY